MRAATDFQLPNGKTLVIPESSADLESEDFAVYVTQVAPTSRSVEWPA